MIKRQFSYFLASLFFFTRIPCGKWVDHSSEVLLKCRRYFSLVGLVIGAIAALVYYLAQRILPLDLSIILSMVSSIWVTGAFHEDGFADVCDGFGGGWTKERILTIMKDSRLGTFGVIGLIAILGTKFLSLIHLEKLTVNILYVIISGHSISRFIASLLLFSHAYVRKQETAKVNHVREKLGVKSLIISGIFGILPLFLFQNWRVFLTLIPLFFTYLYMGYYFKKWIGGQTGDCAGALQQIAEIVFYISLLSLWKLF